MLRDEKIIEMKIGDLTLELEELKKQVEFSDSFNDLEPQIDIQRYRASILALEWVLGKWEELELGKFRPR